MVADLPPAVLKAAKKWDSYLSFVYLSDAFINSPSAKHTSYVNGVLSHPLIDSFPSEDRLDVKTWERCCRTFISLLQKFFPERAVEWENYYNEFYFGGKISDSRWQARLEYDILHRKHTLPSDDLSPDDNILALWELAEERASEKSKMDTRLETVEEAKKLIAASISSHSWSDRPQRKQSNTSDSRPSGDSGFPTGQGASNSRALAPKAAPKPPRVTFCIACGDRGHWASTCEAGAQINGKELRVARNASRVWCLLGGTSVCFNFNSSNGCPNFPCTGRAHVCTLCQSSEHGAFYCKA
jgi:hypothetical protein